MKILTPRMGDQRLSLRVSDRDFAKVRRGRFWSATVTDLATGTRYRLRGASCGSPHCFCDAIAKLAPPTRGEYETCFCCGAPSRPLKYCERCRGARCDRGAARCQG